jgi:hypothetical protein
MLDRAVPAASVTLPEIDAPADIEAFTGPAVWPAFTVTGPTDWVSNPTVAGLQPWNTTE